MPIYEYKCRKCRKTFEVLQKINDTAVRQCLECGGEVDKVISSPAIQFKGSGWYITDYARKTAPGEKAKIKGEKSAPSKKSSPAPRKDKKSSG